MVAAGLIEDFKSVTRDDRVTLAFRLLGPLEMSVNGVVCTPTASKVRQVLALVLLGGNQVVSLDALIEELWADRPPRSAVTTVQTYIYHIRKLLARHADIGLANQRLRTVPPGYLFTVTGDQVDVLQFERAVNKAHELLSGGHTEPARTLLSRALGMWEGDVIAGIEHGRYLRAHAANLAERRMFAVELRLWADMLLGRHRQLIAELKSLVMAHPYNEWLHAQLMISLYESGRRGEALTAYQAARGLLREELGLEPSVELQRIHQRVLNAETLTRPDRPSPFSNGHSQWEPARHPGPEHARVDR